MDVIEHFTKWSSHYDGDSWTWYFNKSLAVALDISKGHICGNASILDIGCGTGKLLSELSCLYPEATFKGIDITPSMVEIARHRLRSNKNIEIIKTDLEGFSDRKKFDIIYCLNVFHHFSSEVNAVEKIKRILNPGGHLIIIDPIRDNPIRLTWEILSKNLFFHEPTIHYLTKRSWISLMNPLGFRKKREIGFLYVALATLWQSSDAT